MWRLQTRGGALDEGDLILDGVGTIVLIDTSAEQQHYAEHNGGDQHASLFDFAPNKLLMVLKRHLTLVKGERV